MFAGEAHHALGDVRESSAIITHHTPTQHPEHFRTSTFDDGNPCEQSRPQVKRQDRLRGGRQVPLFGSNNIVEIGNDCTEHPVAPKLMLTRQGPDHSPHQQKPCDSSRRCPCPDTAFGFIVEQLFTAKSCTVILREGRESLTVAGLSQQ